MGLVPPSYYDMTPFTIDNLPYGVISTAEDPRRRCAVAFGDSAIDVEQLSRDGFFAPVSDLPSNVFAGVSVAQRRTIWTMHRP